MLEIISDILYLKYFNILAPFLNCFYLPSPVISDALSESLPAPVTQSVRTTHTHTTPRLCDGEGRACFA